MLSKRRRIGTLTFTILILSSFLLPLLVVAPTVRGTLLYDSGDPTPQEQLVLEMVNRARSNPVAEGQRLGIDIHEGLTDPSLVGPRPPLAMDKILLGIARAHSQDMYNQNYFSHDDPNGTTPYDRMINAGYDYVRAGENMAAGSYSTAAGLEDLMMVDAGTPGRPHRINLLDLINPYPCGEPPCVYYEVGIGFYQGATPNNIGLSSLITQDFGTENGGPFMLGVVYSDRNGNNFYDVGEGVAGITITTDAGGYYAVSSSAGGYAIPIGTSGTITVTASGPGFRSITRTVTLTGTNVKLDFTTSAQIVSTTSSIQTSSTTSISTTSSTIFSTSSTGASTSQTTTSNVNSPSVALNPVSGPVKSTVNIAGSGFSASDTTCSIYGAPVGSATCSISNGALTASFVVANVSLGVYSLAAMGNPIGDYATALFTINASNSQTTVSTSTQTTVSSSATTTMSSTIITSLGKTEDFSIASSTSTIILNRGDSGSVVVVVGSLNGFNSGVVLSPSWIGSPPAGVTLSITSPVSLSSGGYAASQLMITSNSTASLGVFAIQVTGSTGTLSHTTTPAIIVEITQTASAASKSTTTMSLTNFTSQTSSTVSLPPLPPSCAVSSIISGSELMSLAQGLRVFRDQSIMKTRSGAAFMVLFNSWYYSFSPQLAFYASSHPTQRTVLRYGLYPMIAILYASYYSYLAISPLSPEAGAVTAGIVAASLLGLVYLAPVAYFAKRILRHHVKSSRLNLTHMTWWCATSVLIIEIANFTNPEALAMTVANLVLSMIALGGFVGTAALSRLDLNRVRVFAFGPSTCLLVRLRSCSTVSYKSTKRQRVLAR